MTCLLHALLLFFLFTQIQPIKTTTLNPTTLVPESCNRSLEGNWPRKRRSVFENVNPESNLCLLNVPTSDYCKYWRIVSLILLDDDNEAVRQSKDIRDFLSTVIEYCNQKSDVILFTPKNLNPSCTSYKISTEAQEDALTHLTKDATTVKAGSFPGKILEGMFNQLLDCTSKMPFESDEAGVIFLFTDFLCEELCEQSNIGSLLKNLLINLTYNNKFVARLYFLKEYTDSQANCLRELFEGCTSQQKQLCDMKFYADSESFLKRAELQHTCDKNKQKISTGLVLGITIPVVIIFVAIIVTVILVFKYKMKRKFFSLWFQRERQESEEQIASAVSNEYLDIEKLQTSAIKDLWEIEHLNLEFNTANLLGSGAFASVFRGKLRGTIPLMNIHSSLNVQIEGQKGNICDVAVKKLPNHADEAARLDFQKEMDFMKTLGYHLHIISLLGCVTSKIEPLIIVEYAQNGDLLKYIRARKSHFIADRRASYKVKDSLKLKDLISFSWQISDGMVFLSSNKYIHRDLAARNIFLTKNLVAKIGDFGLCRELDTMLYTTKGGRLPIKWMAPESLRYYEYSTKTDVWAFAVLIFEIFSLGEAPYSTVQPADMPDYLDKGNRLPMPENCPNELYQLMEKCWETKPDSRPSFVQLREDIKQFLNIYDEHYGYLSLNSDDLSTVEEENCPIDLEDFEESFVTKL